MAELVPADVRLVWWRMHQCRIAERERLSEAKRWKERGLGFLWEQALRSALQFRAKRRELAKGLVTR
jgi:hypothetical protein